MLFYSQSQFKCGFIQKHIITMIDQNQILWDERNFTAVQTNCENILELILKLIIRLTEKKD